MDPRAPDVSIPMVGINQPEMRANPRRLEDGFMLGGRMGGRQDHKDSLNRYVRVKDAQRDQDHYLNPNDGRLALLRVQHAENYYRDPSLVTTWSRPLTPHPLVRAWKAYQEAPRTILTWTYNDRLRQQCVMEGTLPESTVPYNPSQIYWKYPIASLVLTATALLGNFEGIQYHNGRYPPVRYKYFSYPTKPRNRREAVGFDTVGNAADPVPPQGQENVDPAPRGRPAQQLGLTDDSVVDGVLVFKRHLRPRKLCVIRDGEGDEVDFVDSIESDDDNSPNKKSEYVFVSYTRLQFQTKPPEDTTENEDTARAERQRLLEIGIRAARDAGVKAFWTDAHCMDDQSVEMESHRICDIARGAKSMVIALQDTVENRTLHRPSQSVDELLQVWSSRLWTLPEMLLAPTRYDLKVYLARDGVEFCETIPKRSMAMRAYRGADATRVRQLVDHFEASQQLTHTELLTIGLECLVGRKVKAHLNADVVYALMTLMRRRPIPNPGDTLFDAFAQLSLLNDSNALLERLICTLPEKHGAPWHDLEDSWGAKLWDIEPTVQVSAIAENETVVLDGGFGATINWDELSKVAFLKRKTFWRSAGVLLISLAPGWLILGITLLASLGRPVTEHNFRTGETTHKTNPAVGVGIFFFLVAFAAIAVLPHTMLSLNGGKFWSTQALLFGLEGRADLEWLEIRLFGFSQGRLKWSTSGSTLSRHRPKPRKGKWVDNEVEAVEPEPEAAPPRGGAGPDRVFTIVDTYSMTATLIRAVHPPVAALVCGQEGGMRRALLCSYDYKTQTFHRETVIRMPTKVLDRMDRVDKFRFSMKSMPLPKNSAFSSRSEMQTRETRVR